MKTERVTDSLTDADLQARIREAASHYWQLAQAQYPGLKRQTLPPLRYDLTGSIAGEVRFERGLARLAVQSIRFNLAIARHNPADSIDTTVGHEIAHVVAVMAHGRRGLGHGPPWREAMAVFGLPPRRCHDYDLSAVPVRRQRRFVYHCQCQQPQMLTTVRHRRQQRGQQRYYCRRCRSPLEYSGRESGDTEAQASIG